jgi:hypothetical protein
MMGILPNNSPSPLPGRRGYADRRYFCMSCDGCEVFYRTLAALEDNDDCYQFEPEELVAEGERGPLSVWNVEDCLDDYDDEKEDRIPTECT